jgi:hypothetical protein
MTHAFRNWSQKLNYKNNTPTKKTPQFIYHLVLPKLKISSSTAKEKNKQTDKHKI